MWVICDSIVINFVFFRCFIRWAVSTVMTRQNLVPSSDGKTMIPALIPLWDLCNHKNGKVKYFDKIVDNY